MNKNLYRSPLYHKLAPLQRINQDIRGEIWNTWTTVPAKVFLWNTCFTCTDQVKKVVEGTAEKRAVYTYSPTA